MNNDSLEESIINEEMQTLRDKKKFKICAICFSIFYISLSPVLLAMGIMPFMAFDSSQITTILFFILIGFIPLSVLIILPLLWVRYFQKKYNSPWLFCLIPIYISFFSFVVIDILDSI
ncbi:MAG: hypothetical protein K1060chlam4_00210 [Candidatus Anoxychlamydiales bacterium]|nr:hypothetical protein [Candidatus Anoxychlamydiales bacterium]